MQKELIFMTNQIDFYFDFISPYSYLAYKKIKELKEILILSINQFFWVVYIIYKE